MWTNQNLGHLSHPTYFSVWLSPEARHKEKYTNVCHHLVLEVLFPAPWKQCSEWVSSQSGLCFQHRNRLSQAQWVMHILLQNPDSVLRVNKLCILTAPRELTVDAQLGIWELPSVLHFMLRALGETRGQGWWREVWCLRDRKDGSWEEKRNSKKCDFFFKPRDVNKDSMIQNND